MTRLEKLYSELIEKKNDIEKEILELNEFNNNNLTYELEKKSIEDDYIEIKDWCFENDIVFRIKHHEFKTVRKVIIDIIMFKNKEDAMAFKLRWL